MGTVWPEKSVFYDNAIREKVFFICMTIILYLFVTLTEYGQCESAGGSDGGAGWLTPPRTRAAPS